MPQATLFHQLQHCAKRHLPIQGKKLHAQIIKSGLHRHGTLYPNTLIDMYGKCGYPNDALKLFDKMPERDLASWASIFTAHNQANLFQNTLNLFSTMFSLDGFKPDHFIFASLVRACASLSALKLGQQVHAQFVVSSFSSDDVVKSSLVYLYAKCGLPENAQKMFNSISVKSVISWTSLMYGYALAEKKSEAIGLLHDMPNKNLHSWTALISAFVQSGFLVDGIRLFIEMSRDGVSIDDPFILSSMIGASASLAMLDLGKQVHRLVMGLGYESSLFISNALIDMYAKCSEILAAEKIFSHMTKRDVVSWTAIIVGMAQHGRADEALALYDKMTSVGIKPNEVTFVGLTYACSHVGLVNRGRQLFKSMVEDYGLKPSLQHYTCLLDLYSRSGLFEEAESLLYSMPFKPDEAVWAALLSACRRDGKREMGIRIANQLMELGPDEPSTCVLLSNTYAGAGMWENVSRVRKIMATMERKKEPGYSCVSFLKENEVFYAGESTHPMKDEIFGVLKELEDEMRRRGYVPDTSSVLHDMGQQEKERQLFWHSERLAVAYGLLKSVRGTTIRIVKNLRVCGDCHVVLKFISSIVDREIVVRDANRFHHFKGGVCSCRDFW